MSAPTTTTPRPPAELAWRDYKPHPLAGLFPLLEGEEFKALVADIKANGLRHKIVLHEGMILDGRNRHRACIEAVRVPEFEDLQPHKDPLDYVLSANLHRRHLTTSQRAMIGAKLITLSPGANQHTKKEAPSIEGTAKLLNVGHASIERARKVLASGNVGLIEQVEKDQITAAKAVKQLEAKETNKPEGDKPEDGKSEKVKIQYATPTDTKTAISACGVHKEHLLDLLENLSKFSSFDHAEVIAEQLKDAIDKKIAGMRPAREEEKAA